MEYKALVAICIALFIVAIQWAYRERKKHFLFIERDRKAQSLYFDYERMKESNKRKHFLTDIKNYISPSFYAAFTAHYWQNNQIVFENESLLHTFLNQYNTLFWGKNTSFDFILAENIDTCNYTKTEKQYNGMTFVGNSENAIPQGYTFLNVFIYQYKVQK